jgi:hypothetical protein
VAEITCDKRPVFHGKVILTGIVHHGPGNENRAGRRKKAYKHRGNRSVDPAVVEQAGKGLLRQLKVPHVLHHALEERDQVYIAHKDQCVGTEHRADGEPQGFKRAQPVKGNSGQRSAAEGKPQRPFHPQNQNDCGKNRNQL